MRKACSRGAAWLVCGVLFFAVFPMNAEDLWDRFSWSAGGSILYFPEDNGNAGDPAPVLPAPRAALAFQLKGPLWVELSEDLYFTHYAYSPALGRAVPAAIENRSAFVFGFFTGIQALGCFSLSDSVNVRVYGGPAMDFRAVTLAGNLHPDDFSGDPESDAQIQTDAIREYFWSKGRWFMPVVGAGMDFAVTEKFFLGFDLRVWFPMYRLSGSENLPPIEGWRFAAGLRLSPRKIK